VNRTGLTNLALDGDEGGLFPALGVAKPEPPFLVSTTGLEVPSTFLRGLADEGTLSPLGALEGATDLDGELVL